MTNDIDEPTEPASEDAAQITRARKKIKRTQQDAHDDLRAVLATPAGRATLRRVLDATSLFATNAHTNESHLTSYRVGRQDVGRWLFTEIVAADPTAIGQMMQPTKDEDIA